VINAVATAYSEVAAENGGWAGVDYFGNALKIGTVAVDPNVIPLGTKLYITGYSSPGLPKGGMYATATDVGGAIKGNRVDIFKPTSTGPVADFGFQNVKIYVLK
jgi:3D (Asp-Asp-Asp) domain-containing protein